MAQIEKQSDRDFAAFLERASRTKPSKARVKEFLLALEAERFDVSYRKTRSVPVKPRDERSKPATTPSAADYVSRIQRDRLFYDAGRFAQGARDEQAIRAFEALNKKGTK